MVTRHLGRKPTLPHDIENDLVKYIIQCESMLFGLTIDEACSMAFDLAEKNAVFHNFNTNTKKAGGWMRLFRSRHPQITLRTPEATSGFNFFINKCIFVNSKFVKYVK